MKVVVWLAVGLMSFACASGKCRQKKDEKTFIEQVQNLPQFQTKESKNIKPGDLDIVRVYKPDGTLQCESIRPLPVSIMKENLEKAGVKVLRVEHRSDGVMHIQMCGAETGMIYVFDIQKLDLAKAQSLGFKKLAN